MHVFAWTIWQKFHIIVVSGKGAIHNRNITYQLLIVSQIRLLCFLMALQNTKLSKKRNFPIDKNIALQRNIALKKIK